MKLTPESRRRMIRELLTEESIITDALPILIGSIKQAKEDGILTADTAAKLTWRLSSKQGRRRFIEQLWQTIDGLCSDYELHFLARHKNNLPAGYNARFAMMGEMAYVDWVDFPLELEAQDDAEVVPGTPIPRPVQ